MNAHTTARKHFRRMAIIFFSLAMLLFIEGASFAGTINDCSGCHSMPPADGPVRSVTTGSFRGKHSTHASATNCGKCHRMYAQNTSNNSHRNGMINMTSAVPTGFTYSKGRFFNQTSMPLNTGTCSNATCHYQTSTAALGGWQTASTLTGTAGCAACHSSQLTAATATHLAHVNSLGNTTNYNTCAYCHPDHGNKAPDLAKYAHATSAGNRSLSVTFSAAPNSGTGQYTGGSINYPAYLPSNSPTRNGTCNNTYCHSDGNINAATPTNVPVTWSGAARGCDGCHGNNAGKSHPVYASGGGNSATANSHVLHVETNGINCAACHIATTTDLAVPPTTVINTYHLNRIEEVQFNTNGGMTGTYSTSAKTCSATYCHGGLSNPWGNGTASAGCGSCHESNSNLATIHNKHINTTTQATAYNVTPTNQDSTGATYQFHCNSCHKGSHMTGGPANVNGAAQVIFNYTSPGFAGAYSFAPTGTTDAKGMKYTTFGTCSNTYCHSDGRTTAVSVVWNTGNTMTCTSCHKGARGSSSAMNSLKHGRHMNNWTTLGANNHGCVDCHAKTVSNNTTVSNRFFHMNKMKNISGAFMGKNYNATTKVCSNLYCHSNGRGVFAALTGSKAWNSTGVLGCNGCHGRTNTLGAPDQTVNNSHAKHVVSITDSRGCASCHRDTVDQNNAGRLHPYSSVHINGRFATDVQFTLGGSYNSSAKTCSSTYCHGTPATPAWGTTLSCGQSCHSGNAGTRTVTSALQGAHYKHYTAVTGFTPAWSGSGNMTGANQTYYQIQCGSCHINMNNPNKSHAGGPVSSGQTAQLLFGYTTATLKGYYSAGGTVSTDSRGFKWTNGTCNNTYCHSDGNGIARAVAWTATLPADCTGCHGGARGSASRINTGKHARHMNNWTTLGASNFKCQSCHNKLVSGNTIIINTSKHINKFKDYSGLYANDNYNPATKTCSSSYCHSDGKGRFVDPGNWNTSATVKNCDGCHGRGVAGTSGNGLGFPIYTSTGAGAFKANSHKEHIGSTNITTTAGCSKCHWRTVDRNNANRLHPYSSNHLDGSSPMDIQPDQSAGITYTYNTTTKTCSDISCHGGTGQNAQWGQIGGLQCKNCHFAATTVANYAKDGTVAKISQAAWEYSGHGKKSGSYDKTNHPFAGFSSAAKGADPCLYCHNKNVLHTAVSYTALGTNPMRLRNFTSALYGKNKVCVVCHMPGGPGVDPDGMGTVHTSKAATTAQNYMRHKGYKHNTPGKGGANCWDCHNPHGESTSAATGPIAMMRANPWMRSYTSTGVRLSVTGTAMLFTNRTTSADDYVRLTGTPTGVCQVCHMQTTYFTASGNGLTHNSTNDCSSCHFHKSGTDFNQAFNPDPNGRCEKCHSNGGAAVLDYSRNNTIAMVNMNAWRYSGHGKESGSYNGTNHPFAGFSSAAKTGNKCLYCHTIDVAHESKNGAYTTVGTNPMRLRNFTSALYGKNKVCIVCHNTGSTGVDPDGSGTVYANKNASIAKSYMRHKGYKHNTPGKGGFQCWDCHNPHGESTSTAGNIAMIRSNPWMRSYSTTGARQTQTGTAILFTSRTTAASDYIRIGGVPTGVCQVCHTQTTYFTASGGGQTHNSTEDCSNCHFHTSGTDYNQAFNPDPNGRCNNCHGSAGAATLDYSRNNVISKISMPAWRFSGHGKNSGTYEGTSHPFAGFSTAAGAKGNPCLYCHTTDVAHETKNGAYSTFGTNPMRLRNFTSASYGNDKVCLACHYPGAIGVDPDGAGTVYALKTAVLAKNYSRHFGSKHGNTNNGGRSCWDCHNPHGESTATGNNILMIRRNPWMRTYSSTGAMQTATGTAVIFTGRTSLASNYIRLGAVTPSGICQVCHINTAYFNRTGGGQTHNTNMDCSTCHKHQNPSPNYDLGFGVDMTGARCEDCHSASSASPSYSRNDGITATINSNAWTFSGHGKTSGTYEGTSHPAANFTVANTSGSSCNYCHTTSVAHVSTSGTYSVSGTNPMRLRNFTSATYGNDKVCIVCHMPGGPGVDPDGSGTTYALKNGTLAKQYSRHFGGRHGDTNNGGRNCWDCHNPHGESTSAGTGNILMIRRNPWMRSYTSTGAMQTATGTTAIFTGRTSTFSNYVRTGAVTPSGICQVCHISTSYWSRTGGGQDHNSTQDCSGCHKHQTASSNYNMGFNVDLTGKDCASCHSAAAASPSYSKGDGTTAVINSTAWTFSGHGKTTGSYALTNHPAANFGGGVLNTNGNACLYCHDETVTHTSASGVYSTTGTNPMRLRNFNSTGDGKNTVCTICHKTGSAGYTPNAAWQNSINASVAKVNSRHEGSGHNSARTGGSLCWDCHNPHGDSTSNAIGPIAMIRANPWMKSYTSTGTRLAATGTAVLFTNRTTNASDYVRTSGVPTGICQVCHTATGFWRNDGTLGSHNSVNQAAWGDCMGCHLHKSASAYDKGFEGTNGDCVDCHMSTKVRSVGPAAGKTLAAASGEFGLAWGHKKTGRGAVTKADCIVCHLEGYYSSQDVNTTYHKNGYIDLRDPDGAGEGVMITGVGAMSTTNFTFARFSTSYAAGTRTTTGHLSNNIDNVVTQKFCLKCHDGNGATNTTARSNGSTNAFFPFNATNPLGAAYNVANGAAAANGLVNAAGQFSTTNSSTHPVMGPNNRGYPTNGRMNAPYNNFSRTAGTLAQGVVINCFDCHNVISTSPGQGLTLRTISAHGASNTLRGLATVTGTALSASYQTSLCHVCHYGYTNWGTVTVGTDGHGAGSAAVSVNSRTPKRLFGTFGCNMCHSSGYDTVVVRPMRAMDMHGNNSLTTYGQTAGGRWSVAGAKPYAFFRNRGYFTNHQPKQIGATTYAVTCGMGTQNDGGGLCTSRGSTAYPGPGGVY